MRNAYCQSPNRSPSRASFMNGRYPRSMRATANAQERWADAAPLLSKLLADGGYDRHTGSQAAPVARRWPGGSALDDGFRTFQWSHGPQKR